MNIELSGFVSSYIETALWSSTVDPYGECPICGQIAVLNRWNPEEYGEHVCSDCSNQEPNYEPPADDNYTSDDLAPETLGRFTLDCMTFIAKLDSIDFAEDDPLDHLPHDFWLTRNDHGAGFWDGDYSDKSGEQLTALAKSFGECNLYVGDDGKLYAY